MHISWPFVTPVVEHWLEREIAHWVHLEGSIGRMQARRTEFQSDVCVCAERGVGGGGWGENASAAGAKLCKEKRLTPL